MNSIDEAFRLASQHHRAGRLKEAEHAYRQVLVLEPEHAIALHLLGVVASQSGQHAPAVELIRRAVAIKPDYPDAHCNLGIALNALGESHAAIRSFRQALTLRPDYAEALSNLGVALKADGQLDDAILSFQRAIEVKPAYAAAHNNLGNALKDKGDLESAIAAFHRSIAANPRLPGVYNNLGLALRARGRADEAITAFQQAVEQTPRHCDTRLNLGAAYFDRGRLKDAIAEFRLAVGLQPTNADAFSNLGTALRESEQLDEALAAFQQSINLNPHSSPANCELANALKDIGQIDEAKHAYRQAIALDPDNAVAGSNLIFTLHCDPASDARAIGAEQARWNRQHAEPLRRFILPHTNDRDPNRRLKIGYVSADFYAHACAYFLTPLFKNHDHQQFEIYFYAQVQRPDSTTESLRRYADHWRSTVGLSDAQMAEQIRADQIDFLVDLKQHTADHRLGVFARKPAPVSVSWLGCPGTTGLTCIDYRFSDPYLDAPEMDPSLRTESTFSLNPTYWCYDPLERPPLPVSALPAERSGKITFGCLNNFGKMNPTVVSLWARILQRLDGSRLLLLVPPGSARQRMTEQFQHAGISADRLEFFARQPRQDYLKLYNRVDLGLDSFPYNGHTTSLDSFWMGVPVVTLIGQTAVSRVGWSLLSNLQLPELAADTPDRFVEIAVSLANDLPRLSQLRAQLRQRMQQSPLMDAPAFAKDVESAYRQMWKRWCDTHP